MNQQLFCELDGDCIIDQFVSRNRVGVLWGRLDQRAEPIVVATAVLLILGDLLAEEGTKLGLMIDRCSPTIDCVSSQRSSNF